MFIKLLGHLAFMGIVGFSLFTYLNIGGAVVFAIFLFAYGYFLGRRGNNKKKPTPEGK